MKWNSVITALAACVIGLQAPEAMAEPSNDVPEAKPTKPEKAATTAAGNNLRERQAANEGFEQDIMLPSAPPSKGALENLDGEGTSVEMGRAVSHQPSREQEVLLTVLAALISGLLAGGLAHWLAARRLSGLEARCRGLEDKQQRLRNDFHDLKTQLGDKMHDRDFGLTNPAHSHAAPGYGNEDYFAASPSPTMVSPAPPPRPQGMPTILQTLREEVARLATTPGLRSDAYDTAISKFGSLRGIIVDETSGSARLVPIDQDINRRLVAVLVSDGGAVAIVPSSRYIKNFSMTYKEKLEAGNDVKTMFDCIVDGSATIRIKQLAQATVDENLNLSLIAKGILSGYL